MYYDGEKLCGLATENVELTDEKVVELLGFLSLSFACSLHYRPPVDTSHSSSRLTCSPCDREP
jgi:hypothetical protein